jgi:hypothetical protein
MALPNLSRLSVSTAGSAASRALVFEDGGPWSEIKAALNTRELTFNVRIKQDKSFFTIRVYHWLFAPYDEETATPEMSDLVANVRTPAIFPTLAVDARAAFFDDTTPWCMAHSTFPTGDQPVAPDENGFFANSLSPLDNSADDLVFGLSPKVMKWFGRLDEKGVDGLAFFIKSLAARIAHRLHKQYALSYVVKRGISRSADMTYELKRKDEARFKGKSIDSIPTLEQYQDASVAAPDGASYVRFPMHPFSRIAPVVDINLDDVSFASARHLLQFQLRFVPLAKVRQVSKDARAVGQ